MKGGMDGTNEGEAPAIRARVVADSNSIFDGKMKRITSVEVELPKFLLAEVNTHKILSKNYSSTRAIPLKRQMEMVGEHPFIPVFFGRNQSGMQAKEELSAEEITRCLDTIYAMLQSVQICVDELGDIGLHKQTAGRYLEPFMYAKGVLTGTEWENFFYLRDEESAQPEFQMLAKAIRKAMNESDPVFLNPGEWHLPYYKNGYWKPFEAEDSLEDAKMISISCCAQVSYRRNDDSIEKARQVYGKLGLDGSGIPHASVAEHQATPMKFGVGYNYPHDVDTWEEGVTAYHKELGFMSGNLSGWVQNRQLLNNHTKWGNN